MKVNRTIGAEARSHRALSIRQQMEEEAGLEELVSVTTATSDHTQTHEVTDEDFSNIKGEIKKETV